MPVRFGGQSVSARAVILLFTGSVAAGVTINISTGGGVATVTGDAVALPASGAAFKANDRFVAALNGHDLIRGSSAGDEEINWISSVQVQLAVDVIAGDRLTIKRF